MILEAISRIFTESCSTNLRAISSLVYPALSSPTSSIKMHCKRTEHSKLYQSPFRSFHTSSKYMGNELIQSPLGMSIQIPNTSLTNHVFEHVDVYSSTTAMECSMTERKYTYGELHDMCKKFGSYLLRQGFKKQDRIVIISPNVPEYPIALLGAAGVGIIVSLVNPLYTPDETARLMEIVQPKLLITIPLFAELAQMTIQMSPSIQKMMVLGSVPEGINAIPFSDVLKDDGSLCSKSVITDNSIAIAFIPFSSGTSGAPKAVMLTHRNLIANNIQIEHEQIRFFKEESHKAQPGKETTLAILPFFHCYSFMGNMITGLRRGIKIVTVPKFDPEGFVALLEIYKPTFLLLVPPLLNFLATSPDVKLEHLEKLHTVAVGGAPCGEVIINKFLKKAKGLNITVREGYGLTETSPCTHAVPVNVGNKAKGSIGVLLPGTEAKLVDEDTGKSVAEGESGELYIRGPQVMRGYYKNEKATKKCITSDFFLKTGDRGNVDKDGLFHIVERTKDMIKVKGNQVAPAELEEVLRSLPQVKEAAVIGIPDLKYGEVPRAYIVLEEGQKITPEEIQAYFKQKMAPFKQLLGGIVFVDEVPKNIIGKILRRVLRDQFKPEEKV